MNDVQEACGEVLTLATCVVMLCDVENCVPGATIELQGSAPR
jgi:hypothetical protein